MLAKRIIPCLDCDVRDGKVVVLKGTRFEGLRFAGDEGWNFCTRGDEADAAGGEFDRDAHRPLRASDQNLLSPLAAGAVRWMPSKSHYGNWLECISTNRQPIAPIQQSARSLEACAAAWIAMKLRRQLNWDAAAERFIGDDAANALRERKARKSEYDYALAMKRAGIEG